MKKVSKIFLKESAEILEKEEMKLIFGGNTIYTCICYNGDGPVYYELTHEQINNLSTGHGANLCYDLGYLHGGCSF